MGGIGDVVKEGKQRERQGSQRSNVYVIAGFEAFGFSVSHVPLEMGVTENSQPFHRMALEAWPWGTIQMNSEQYSAGAGGLLRTEWPSPAATGSRFCSETKTARQQLTTLMHQNSLCPCPGLLLREQTPHHRPHQDRERWEDKASPPLLTLEQRLTSGPGN